MAPILYYGPFAPPANGQRIAHEAFYRLLAPEADLRHIPIEGVPVLPSIGSYLSKARVLSHVRGQRALGRALDQAPGATVYFCAAGSGRGILRDLSLVARTRSRAGRIVAHVHSGNYEAHWETPARRRMATWLAERLDAIVVPTETQAARVRPVVGATPVHVVSNVVDDRVRLTDAEVEASWALRARPGPLRVLYLSNFIPSKGYLDVIAALARTTTSVEATLAGTWSDTRSYEEALGRIRALQLGARVRVLPPYSTREAVKDALSRHHVVVLPTTYPSEAQPLAILEAMANGCAVVATRHASIPEYVTDGENGLLVPPHDPGALAVAFDRLTDLDWALALGRRGRTVADRVFSPEHSRASLREALGLVRYPPTVSAGGQSSTAGDMGRGS